MKCHSSYNLQQVENRFIAELNKETMKCTCETADRCDGVKVELVKSVFTALFSYLLSHYLAIRIFVVERLIYTPPPASQRHR